MAKKAMAWYELLDKLVEAKALPPRTCLYGPPGVGKSLWATVLGAHERITLHQQIDPADLLGSVTLATGEGGNTITGFNMGPAARAIMNDVPLVVDEIDQMGPEVTCIMHALMDEPAAVTLPNGQRLVAKNGNYRVICTTNANPMVLSPAILDRFEMVLQCLKPNPKAMELLPKEYREVCENHYERIKPQDFSRSVSFRTCLAISRLESPLGRAKAAVAVLGDAAGAEFEKVVSVCKSAATGDVKAKKPETEQKKSE